MKKILISSDIILDVLYSRPPFCDDSAKILSLCEEKKVQAVITPVTLNNVFYSLKKSAAVSKIAEKMSLLLTFLDIQPIEKKDFIEAFNTDFTDFEGMVNNFAAENSYSIFCVVTRHAQDYKNLKISVLSPKEFLESHNF